MRPALTIAHNGVRFQEISVIRLHVPTICRGISAATAGQRAARCGARAQTVRAAGEARIGDALEEHVVAPGAGDAEVARGDAERREAVAVEHDLGADVVQQRGGLDAVQVELAEGQPADRRRRPRCRRRARCGRPRPSSRGARSGTRGARRSRARSRRRARRPRGSGSGRRCPRRGRARRRSGGRAGPRACRSRGRDAGPTARDARARR